MANELRRKLVSVKLLDVWNRSPRSKIRISFDQCEFEASIKHVELEAHLTLVLTISAPHALFATLERKDIYCLRYTTHWQLFFTDGTSIDVKVQEAVSEIY